MASYMHCDHCKEIAEDARQVEVPRKMAGEVQTWDLCEACLAELNDWLPWSP